MRKKFARAGWTSLFSLDFTQFLCLDQDTSKKAVWLRIASSPMYFAFWFLIFAFHWLVTYKWSRKHHALKARNVRSTLFLHLLQEPDSSDHLMELQHAPEKSSPSSSSSTTTTVTLSEESNDVDTLLLLNAGELSEKAKNENWEKIKKSLCRRYRFLRALEMIMLFSYEILTDIGLQLLNCVDLGSCGSVLAEFPDISCHSSEYTPLQVIAWILVVYSVAFPAVVWYSLYRIHKTRARHANEGAFVSDGISENVDDGSLPDTSGVHSSSLSREHSIYADLLAEAKYGVFYDHFHEKFWWWEIQVRSEQCLFFFF